MSQHWPSATSTVSPDGAATDARGGGAAPRGSATRERILEVAAVLLARFTAAKLTMEDVARAAGVTRQTVYKHFGSKDELMISLFSAELNNQHRPHFEGYRDREPTPGLLLEAIMLQVSLSRAYPLFDPLLDPTVAPRTAEMVFGSESFGGHWLSLWVPLLRAHQEAGVIRKDLVLEDAARWIAYQQFWFITRPGVLTSDEDELRTYVQEFVVAALLARD